MPSVPINYWAVLVAAVAQMILGFLWYGPLFGKPWMKMMGWTKESMQEMRKSPKFKKQMNRNYLIMSIGAFLMAYTLDHALIFASVYLAVYGSAAGLMAGFWNWLGFIAPITVGVVLWEGKSWKLWFLNAGYYLVGF